MTGAQHLEAWGWSDGIQTTISPTSIMINGEEVVMLEDGRVATRDKRGGRYTLYIQPLFANFIEQVASHKRLAAESQKPYQSVMTLVVDRTTPYRLLEEVMYTADQAQISNFRIALRRADDSWQGFEASSLKFDEGGNTLVVDRGASGLLKTRRMARLRRGTARLGSFCEKGSIRPVVARGSGAIKTCYEKALQKTPDLHGKVVVNWTVNQQGHVTKASISQSTMPDKSVESCMTRVVQRWRFAPSKGGQCVVTQPFTFTATLRLGDSAAIEPPQEEAKVPFALNVEVSTSGLSLRANGSKMARKAYDMRRLYNMLVALKAKHPDELSIRIHASPDIPMETIAALVAVVRYKRLEAGPDGTFADDEAFNNTGKDSIFQMPSGANNTHEALFPKVVLMLNN